MLNYKDYALRRRFQPPRPRNLTGGGAVATVNPDAT